MEIDPPHESDGSTNGSKEGEIYLVSDNDSGYGLPYAPEDFPNPGDKWGWKVGKRVNASGNYLDRYLYLPDRLYKELKLKGFTSMTTRRDFASKSSVERFVMEVFPGTDVKVFFDSFTWKIPSGKIKGELSQCETDTFEVSNFREPSQREAALPQISFSNFDYRSESIALENRIKKTLASLMKSQETEYMIADDVLMTQKNHLLDLYEELDKEKKKLAKCSPSADPSLVHGVFKRMDQVKKEFDKITAMQAVGKGFGKTPKYILKEHFGVQADN